MPNKIILSLSTIPARFDLLGESLNSLLNQSKKADEIHVYIPKNYKRFPNHEFSTPSVPEGVLGPVEIHRVRMIVAPMWIMASKLISVLHARIAIRLNSLSF